MNTPDNDGLTHINIYSKSKTLLGRMLSNFYKCKIETPLGYFSSIEGYWFYLGTRNEKLRNLNGYEAKKFGSSLPRIVTLKEDEFKSAIYQAMVSKIKNNPGIYYHLSKSTLPFTHYYVFNNIIHPAGFDWLVIYWENIRNQIKENKL